MKKLFFIAVLLSLTTSCTSESDVEKYARKEQWDTYKIEGYCFLGCGKDDFFQTSFTAKKNGVTFKGCTCSGLWTKNATMRLD